MKKLYSVGLGFSSNCNMNCPFCYSRAKRNEGRDLSLDVWYDFFRRNASSIGSVNYGTGENTTSDAWYALINHIHEHYPHIRQAVTTNGSLYPVQKDDSEKREAIIRSIDEVDVSLDFGEREMHNACRGNSHAFDWVLGTLEFCQAHDILPTIVTLGTNETLKIENMERIFKIAQQYGAKVRINLYRPVQKDCEIRPASLESILKFFDWADREHQIVSISDPLFSALLCGDTIAPDPSGSSRIRITQDGSIYPSTYLLFEEFLMGNIRDFHLDTDIPGNPGADRLLHAPIPSACKKCPKVFGCRGGVLDRRYLWYKDFKERDPYCFAEHPELFRHYRTHKEAFASVHDGYLPTLFFKN